MTAHDYLEADKVIEIKEPSGFQRAANDIINAIGVIIAILMFVGCIYGMKKCVDLREQ